MQPVYILYRLHFTFTWVHFKFLQNQFEMYPIYTMVYR